MSGLTLKPITLRDATAYVVAHHRHHGAPRGCCFCLSAYLDEQLVGVAIVGRPVARGLQDGYTAEVTRLCTDGTKNACSFLYAAAWRACRAIGYRRLVTYILADETGTSLRAAGWREVAAVRGRSWSCESRPRIDKHPTVAKTRFEVGL